ncbi:MAG TPA: phosphopentomutase [Gemmatimonadales bacterium]|jgi:phosphopentomutase|nr:phosphopentomutase [Gemmatimonadales bacterium]
MARRAAIIVLDGLGIGPAHDTEAYGDAGSATLGNVLRASGGLALPNLERLGLGCCAPLSGVAAVPAPQAAYGTAQPASAGKDSITGHWEICGVILKRPFPTYPRGFPAEVIAEFVRRTGRGVLANKPASGTAILEEFGAQHQQSGKWIVYTSADSVFQVAAHEEVVPLHELYAACAAGRDMLRGEHGVSRVIARPFVGPPGHYRRTPNRKDFSLEPVGTTLLDRLDELDIPRVGVGKVDDLFAGRGITSTHTPTNADAYGLILAALTSMSGGLLLANVIEFDQSWGHRNDVPGFLAGLEELDRALPGLLEAAQAEDLIIFTADHGNDPTTPSTDHSRERVPILVYGPRVGAVSLGERATFADIGQTVADFLGVAPLAAGTSFLPEVWRG